MESIASRCYEIVAANGTIENAVLSVCPPRPDPGDDETWMCKVIWDGAGRSRVQEFSGVDAIQALIMAVNHVDLMEDMMTIFYLADKKVIYIFGEPIASYRDGQRYLKGLSRIQEP